MSRFVCVVVLLFLAIACPLTAQQVPLPGKNIPQFVDPLPNLDVVVDNGSEINLNMFEFKANVLPTGFLLPNGQPYTGTWVWGYINGTRPATNRSTYLGPIIVAKRGNPTQIRFTNNLGHTDTSNLLAWVSGNDQTLHWADPLGMEMNHCAHMMMMATPPTGTCAQHYSGPIPAVPHLHGGEVPPVIDGGPDAWFTSDGVYKGHGFYTHPGVPVASNEVVYRYPNTQESAPIWFHDHTLGATRLNVYAGLAGGYLITDPSDPQNLPPLTPLVLQDRMFDTNGQLYFPNLPLNPEHPFWVPEFVGDTIVVNGKAWPYVNVQARRQRFIFVNGSNARTYELFLVNQATKVMGPAIWQIGTDGGYLDRPVKIDPNAPKGQMQRLVLMPGERADVIIDFTGLAGQNLILRNNGRTPYPKGAAPSGTTLGQIVQFRVGAAAGADTSYNPATLAPLRTPMVRLVNTATATPAAGVAVAKTRQLSLNEVMGMPTVVNGVAYPGGPLEILVNNTKWDGKVGDGMNRAGRSDFIPVTINGVTDYYSEAPTEGTTEIWEIVNLTADAHPIHLHLTTFQLLSRQAFNTNNYNAAYAAAFPGGLFIGGYGPPLNYSTGNPRALGGNPDITPFLQGPRMLPNANEMGWKDTIMANPGEVTRFVVRFAPNSTPVNGAAPYYPFDPQALGHGYVWHCHIIDHEDNEMMRPYIVNPDPAAVNTRTYLQGIDY